ncbi:GNAT family N-acetyltransferase [Streptomyces hydrogenans]|uniref:GNAT family N-acetyltransferase n=1 Tax=Streptomyces hydrogenans TaxID=1873719 RepID=UPI0034123652
MRSSTPSSAPTPHPRWFGFHEVEALVRKGFTDLEVERVSANAMVTHPRSRRVMEKSGPPLIRNVAADWPEQT